METSNVKKDILAGKTKRSVQLKAVEAPKEPESPKVEPIAVPIVASEPPKLEVTIQEPPKPPTLEERVGMIETILNNIILKIKEAQAAATQVQPSQGKAGIMEYLPLLSQVMGSGSQNPMMEKLFNTMMENAMTDSMEGAVLSRVLRRKALEKIAPELIDGIDKMLPPIIPKAETPKP